MKKIFTLYSIVVFAFLSKPASAQLNEKFENGLAALTADCWQFSSMMFAANPSGFVITGNGTLYSEPPVSSDSVRIMRTPLLDVASSFTVTYNYRLSGNLNGMATRYMKIDLVDISGNIVQNLDSFQITNAATSTATYNNSFGVITPGIYRLSITMGGKTGAGNVRLSMDNLTANSTVIGCSLAASPLPVHLISFQGSMNKNNKVTLLWKVADNEIANYFEVQRSSNGTDFSTIGVVFATDKNGTEEYTYYETVNSSEKVMYRLKMIDKHNEEDFSKILMFQTKSANSAIKIFNNPVTDKLTFSFTASSTHNVQVRIYDMTGRLQLNQNVNGLEGNNMISLPLSSAFKAGFYVVEVNDGTEIQTAKFVKK